MDLSDLIISLKGIRCVYVRTHNNSPCISSTFPWNIRDEEHGCQPFLAC